MKMYVLIVGDHYNGVTRVHGVFSSEEKAEQAWQELAYDTIRQTTQSMISFPMS